MRGNGLSAAAYVAVADVAPESADALLLALADHGVAAYASPSPEAAGALEIDRLYVDSAAEPLARTLIAEQLAADFDSDLDPTGALERDFALEFEPSDPVESVQGTFDGMDVDAAFAQIVAGFERETSAADPEQANPPVQPPPIDATLGWGDLLRPAIAEPVDYPSDRYIPPPPEPLPETDAITRFGWAGVVGGPALLFGAVLFDWQLESWVLLLAALGFLAGFVALVTRLEFERDRDDPDDGAVV